MCSFGCLGRYGGVVWWSFWWVGVGSSRRELGFTSHFSPIIGPNFFLALLLLSFTCVVSWQIHAWQSGKTLMVWKEGFIVLWDLYTIGPRWVSMYTCPWGCLILCCGYLSTFEDPQSFHWELLWVIMLCCMWGFLHLQMMLGIKLPVKT